MTWDKSSLCHKHHLPQCYYFISRIQEGTMWVALSIWHCNCTFRAEVSDGCSGMDSRCTSALGMVMKGLKIGVASSGQVPWFPLMHLAPVAQLLVQGQGGWPSGCLFQQPGAACPTAHDGQEAPKAAGDMLKGYYTLPKVLPWCLWVGSGKRRETLQSRTFTVAAKKLSLYICIRFFYPFEAHVLFNGIQASFRVAAPIKHVHPSKWCIIILKYLI